MIIIHAKRKLPGTGLLSAPGLVPAVSLNRQRLPDGDPERPPGPSSLPGGVACQPKARPRSDSSACHQAPQTGCWIVGRLLCRALCQGAALHFLDGRNGVKDFDVWSFYAALDDAPLPYRWRGTADFGPSRFGRYPGDPPSYTGRRVDFLGRSLPVPPGADPAAALRDYLAARHTATAKALAAKAVILISPDQRLGECVWP